MKILFVGRRDADAASGVEKKMEAQIAALRALKQDVWYTRLSGTAALLCHNEDADEVLFTFSPHRSVVKNAILFDKMILAASSRKDFDVCYIRKALCSAFHLHVLHLLRRRGIEIIEEIPTYPYDDEFKHAGLAGKIWLTIDKAHRGQYIKYIHHFVTFTPYDEIFGVPVVSIANGVDTDALPMHIPSMSQGCLRLLSVAKVGFWHGYDRILMGMEKYFAAGGTQHIEYHIVGTGPDTEHLKQLTKILKLQNNVVFYEDLAGQALDAVFEQSDIAVSSLALHRKQMTHTSELKIREYMARGIPFLSSGLDGAVPENFVYRLMVPPNNEPIDMQDVIQFAYAMAQKPQAAQEMRSFARAHMDWAVQMEKAVILPFCIVS